MRDRWRYSEISSKLWLISASLLDKTSIFWKRGKSFWHWGTHSLWSLMIFFQRSSLGSVYGSGTVPSLPFPPGLLCCSCQLHPPKIQRNLFLFDLCLQIRQCPIELHRKDAVSRTVHSVSLALSTTASSARSRGPIRCR